MNSTTAISTRLSAFLLLAGAVVSHANMITNPSFETAAGNVPAGWWSTAFWGGSHAGTGWNYITTGTAGVNTYDGVGSVELQHPAVSNEYVYTSVLTAVTPGETLFYSTWVKAANFSDTNEFGISLDYFNSTGGYAGSGLYAAVSGNGDWRQITVSGAVPAGIYYVQPLLHCWQSSSNPESYVIFDAVSLVPEPASLLILLGGATTLLVRRQRK